MGVIARSCLTNFCASSRRPKWAKHEAMTTTCGRPHRIFLKRKPKHLGASSREKVAHADGEMSIALAPAGVEATGRFEMLNPKIVLASPQSKLAAQKPAMSITRV